MGNNLSNTNGVTGGGTPLVPADWVRAADLAADLQKSPRWVREWVARHVADADQQRARRATGGAPELWLAPGAAAALRGHFNGVSTGGSTGGGTPLLTAGAESAEVWRMMLARADREADALRADLRAARDEALTAARRAEEAEAGRHAALARVDALRAAWWRWYALANGPWWRRLRGLPRPPAEVDEPPLLAAPRG